MIKLISLLAAAVTGLVLASTGPAAGPTAKRDATVVVGYVNGAALEHALRVLPADVVRRLPALEAAVVRPKVRIATYVRVVRRLPGIAYVDVPAARVSYTEPALALGPTGQAVQWQYQAARFNVVPEAVTRAASAITIAVIDTGADLTAPDIAAKAPTTYNVTTRSTDVRDFNGHGTFVASLAAGSSTNSEGIAGAGGDAKLMIIQAGRADGAFTDVEEAAAIVYAVDHGARIINLSFGGPDTSKTEQRAVDYAVSKGALLVAAAGNEYAKGNPVEYPAALLQPVGSNGVGGRGLSVGASTPLGARAAFSNTGSYISLVAPGERVLGALSSSAPITGFQRYALPGSSAGLYGYASGTSFAVPQVAGAAALVWAANPSLSAAGVSEILKQTATGRGTWNADLGYGIIDAGAAVERAGGGTVQITPPAAVLLPTLRDMRLTGFHDGRRVHLNWTADGASAFRLSVKTNNAGERVLLAQTKQTSATFRVSAGYTYTFRVTSLDSAGATTATSPPFVVRVKR